MLVYTSFTLIWYATRPHSVKKKNDLLTPPTPGVKDVFKDSIFAFMVLCAQFLLMWYATWLLSEKDKVWPPTRGQGCVRGQSFCYHIAASVVSCNLICNMTIFQKSLILASGPTLFCEKLLNILTHTSNPKCFTNVTLINIQGLAEIIYRSWVMADIHPIRLWLNGNEYWWSSTLIFINKCFNFW